MRYKPCLYPISFSKEQLLVHHTGSRFFDAAESVLIGDSGSESAVRVIQCDIDSFDQFAAGQRVNPYDDESYPSLTVRPRWLTEQPA